MAYYAANKFIFSDRENKLNCKTVLIRKVTDFIEKNAFRLVYTEPDSCSII